MLGRLLQKFDPRDEPLNDRIRRARTFRGDMSVNVCDVLKRAPKIANLHAFNFASAF